MESVEHCNEEGWGYYLLETMAREMAQELAPKYTITDGGMALRAGQKAVIPPPVMAICFRFNNNLGKWLMVLETVLVVVLVALCHSSELSLPAMIRLIFVRSRTSLSVASSMSLCSKTS